MRYTISGGLAAFAICLAGLQPASAQVNDERDALAFAVREGEIAREKAAAARGEEAAKIEPASKTEQASKSEDAAVEAPVEAAGKPSAKRNAKAVVTAPEGSEGLKALVARHASANGVPFALADAIVRLESRYNPRAAHAGNYGLMQIRHQTARGMGYSGGAAGLLDAETNARFGMKYLAMAYKLAGGDTCRTIMKYQSGHRSERMSGANRTYCAKVRTISVRN